MFSGFILGYQERAAACHVVLPRVFYFYNKVKVMHLIKKEKMKSSSECEAKLGKKHEIISYGCQEGSQGTCPLKHELYVYMCVSVPVNVYKTIISYS